jgi:hypothetical protein
MGPPWSFERFGLMIDLVSDEWIAIDCEVNVGLESAARSRQTPANAPAA